MYVGMTGDESELDNQTFEAQILACQAIFLFRVLTFWIF